MQTINEQGRVPIYAWVDGVEFDQGTQEQLRQVASLPVVGPHIAAMPDAHKGNGACVGSVIPTRKAIVPSTVGTDIGCGMDAVEINISSQSLPDNMQAVYDALMEAIPVGNGNPGNWAEPPADVGRMFQDMMPGLEPLEDKVDLDLERACRQLGTLGGGNHFIEVCLDQADRVWLMLHSGSRGIGNRLGTTFIQKAKTVSQERGDILPDRSLGWLEEGTPEFKDYVWAVEWAQRYAKQNRNVMMGRALRTFAKTLGRSIVGMQRVSCHHNYLSVEEHFGEMLYITRKGAVSARKDELGIIPGSMGTKSYIVRGKGKPESFMSCSHGAGRRMSRTAARATLTLEQHAEATAGVICRKDIGVIDESPASYKDIDSVIAAQSDLIEVVRTLKAIVCVKG